LFVRCPSDLPHRLSLGWSFDDQAAFMAGWVIVNGICRLLLR